MISKNELLGFELQEVAESYMDSTSPSKKASTEVARESLIAISYSLAELQDFNFASESKTADGVAVSNCEGEDKFRSELISISYTESHDAKI